mmetsp:Transcript_33442/g.104190  ORF Transcript_33442/g.104190 Transcript_33442/m.104190 type:complete len:331 (-) Transcript_33442:429-1421(-)
MPMLLWTLPRSFRRHPTHAGTRHERLRSRSAGGAPSLVCASQSAANSSAKFPRILEAAPPSSSGPTCASGSIATKSSASLAASSAKATAGPSRAGAAAASPDSSSTRGAASVRRSRAPGVFVSSTASMRTGRSSWWSRAPSARGAEASPARCNILSSLRRSSASAGREMLPGAAPNILLASSAAREEIRAGSTSSSCESRLPGSAARSASGSISGSTRSRTPSANTRCMALGRTTSRLARAANNRDVAPAPGIGPLTPPSRYMESSSEAGPSSAHSPRSAATNGSRHFSSTAAAKELPSRTTLQAAPAARPQSRQFIGRSCRPSASTSSS